MGEKGYGDRLARGMGRAEFGSMSHVSQDKWEEIFGKPEVKPKPKRKPKAKK